PATGRLAGLRGALDRGSRVAGGLGAAAGHGAFDAAGRLRRAGHHRVLALFPQLSLRYRLLRHHGHAVHILAVIGRAVTIALFVRQRADGSNLIGIIWLLATGFPRVDGTVVRRKLSLLWRRRAWERCHQPEKDAQSKKPASHIAHMISSVLRGRLVRVVS